MIVKTDGTVQEVSIGEKEEDPVFVVTDLLIHLAGKQMEKKASVVIEGEKLDLLIGSRPLEKEERLDESEKEAVKANVMRILTDYYDMEEEDFLSAELEIVPAGKARDCGIDRSMILAYGQDDRSVHLPHYSLCWMSKKQCVPHAASWLTKKRSEVLVQPVCIPASLKMLWQNW